MANARFGLYYGSLGLNYGTPVNNKPVHGNAVNTQALVDTAIDNMIADVLNSPITDLMVWLLHFPDSGSPFVNDPNMLVLNGIPVVPAKAPNGDLWSLSPNLPAKIGKLRAAGKNVVVSMGGWDGSGTFGQIASIGVDAFITQLETQVFKPYNINGLDIDLEGGSTIGWGQAYQQYSPVIVELSLKLASRGYVVTHAPAFGLSTGFYTSNCPGLPNNQPILEATYDASTGKNAISWLNVQFYAGGNPWNSQAAVSGYEGMVNTLKPLAAKTGISSPEQILLAGFQPCVDDPTYGSGSQRLTDSCSKCNPAVDTVVMDALNGIAAQYPSGYGGTFDWLYQYFVNNQDGYASQQNNWTTMATAL